MAVGFGLNRIVHLARGSSVCFHTTWVLAAAALGVWWSLHPPAVDTTGRMTPQQAHHPPSDVHAAIAPPAGPAGVGASAGEFHPPARAASAKVAGRAEVLASDLWAPLAPAFEALSVQARAGDAVAAAELYRALSHCEANDRDAASASLAPRNDAEVRVGLALQIRQCDARRLCHGLSAAQRRDPTQWLLHAADAGDRSARLQFAVGNMLLRRDLDILAHVPRYRQVAHAWLSEAAQQGSLLALQGLSAMHATAPGAGGHFDGVAPHDPVLAYAYARLARERTQSGTGVDRWLQREEAALQSELSAAELVRGVELLRAMKKSIPAPTPDGVDDGLQRWFPWQDEVWLEARAVGCLPPEALRTWRKSAVHGSPR